MMEDDIFDLINEDMDHTVFTKTNYEYADELKEGICVPKRDDPITIGVVL